MSTRLTLILVAGLALIGLAYLLAPSPAPPPPVAPSIPSAAKPSQEPSAPPALSVKQEATPVQPTRTTAKVALTETPYILRTEDGTDVRLRGVSLPEGLGPKETVEGKVRSFLLKEVKNKPLSLENTGERDDRGNLLVYAYLPNGMMLNGVLLSSGYAVAETRTLTESFPAQFVELEQRARTKGRGLWKPSSPK